MGMVWRAEAGEPSTSIQRSAGDVLGIKVRMVLEQLPREQFFPSGCEVL